jgi:hypothetical protein
MDYEDVYKALNKGRYVEVANVLYKEIMFEKYGDMENLYIQIKNNREKKVKDIEDTLSTIFLNKFNARKQIEKLTQKDKIMLTEEVYKEVKNILKRSLAT